jgi:hypothetical protein
VDLNNSNLGPAMSLQGHELTWRNACVTSALPPRATKQQTSDEVASVPILLQKSAILVVGLPLRPLEADSDYSFSQWTLVGV